MNAGTTNTPPDRDAYSRPRKQSINQMGEFYADILREIVQDKDLVIMHIYYMPYGAYRICARKQGQRGNFTLINIFPRGNHTIAEHDRDSLREHDLLDYFFPIIDP